MPVFIIDKLKPKNNGVFKLMDTLNIEHKGYDLESYIDSLEHRLEEITNNPSDNLLLEVECVDHCLLWKYANEDEDSWKVLIDLDEIDEVYVGSTKPTNENIKLWIDTSEKQGEEPTELIIPTKLSELENNMDFITPSILRQNLSLERTEGKILLKYGDDIIGLVTINKEADK